MCSLGRRIFCAYDWNDLPVGREFEGHFFKIMSNPYAPPVLPPPPPPPRRLYIDRCIITRQLSFWVTMAGSQGPRNILTSSIVRCSLKRRCSQNNNNNEKKDYNVTCNQRIKNNSILRNPNLGWPWVSVWVRTCDMCPLFSVCYLYWAACGALLSHVCFLSKVLNTVTHCMLQYYKYLRWLLLFLMWWLLKEPFVCKEVSHFTS